MSELQKAMDADIATKSEPEWRAYWSGRGDEMAIQADGYDRYAKLFDDWNGDDAARCRGIATRIRTQAEQVRQKLLTAVIDLTTGQGGR